MASFVGASRSAGVRVALLETTASYSIETWEAFRAISYRPAVPGWIRVGVVVRWVAQALYTSCSNIRQHMAIAGLNSLPCKKQCSLHPSQ